MTNVAELDRRELGAARRCFGGAGAAAWVFGHFARRSIGIGRVARGAVVRAAIVERAIANQRCRLGAKPERVRQRRRGKRHCEGGRNEGEGEAHQRAATAS